MKHIEQKTHMMGTEEQESSSGYSDSVAEFRPVRIVIEDYTLAI